MTKKMNFDDILALKKVCVAVVKHRGPHSLISSLSTPFFLGISMIFEGFRPKLQGFFTFSAALRRCIEYSGQIPALYVVEKKVSGKIIYIIYPLPCSQDGRKQEVNTAPPSQSTIRIPDDRKQGRGE